MSHHFEPTIVVRRTLILNIPQEKIKESPSQSSTTTKSWRRAENLHWPLIPLVSGDSGLWRSVKISLILHFSPLFFSSLFFTRNINNSHSIRLSAWLTASREPNHRTKRPLKTVGTDCFLRQAIKNPRVPPVWKLWSVQGGGREGRGEGWTF